MLRCALFLCALGLTAACGTLGGGGGGEPVELDVDRLVYGPGDSLTVTLRNRSGSEVGYNLCPAALEISRAGAWAPAASLAEVCTMELRVLASGATATYRHRLPVSLATGEYRVRVSVERPLGGAQAAVTSAPFNVR